MAVRFLEVRPSIFQGIWGPEDTQQNGRTIPSAREVAAAAGTVSRRGDILGEGVIAEESQIVSRGT